MATLVQIRTHGERMDARLAAEARAGIVVGVCASLVFIGLWELATVLTDLVGPTLSDLAGRRASVAVYVALVIGAVLGLFVGRLLPRAGGAR